MRKPSSVAETTPVVRFQTNENESSEHDTPIEKKAAQDSNLKYSHWQSSKKHTYSSIATDSNGIDIRKMSLQRLEEPALFDVVELFIS